MQLRNQFYQINITSPPFKNIKDWQKMRRKIIVSPLFTSASKTCLLFKPSVLCFQSFNFSNISTERCNGSYPMADKAGTEKVRQEKYQGALGEESDLKCVVHSFSTPFLILSLHLPARGAVALLPVN